MTVIMKPQGIELHCVLTWKIFKFSKLKWWDDCTPSLLRSFAPSLLTQEEVPYGKVGVARRKIGIELLKKTNLDVARASLDPRNAQMPLKMEWVRLLATVPERIPSRSRDQRKTNKSFSCITIIIPSSAP